LIVTIQGETPMKTFVDFIKTDLGRQSCDAALCDRLTRANASISSLSELLKFAKERWPDHYPADPRKSSGKPCGRDAMQLLWSIYLTWAEALDEAARKETRK
jgi:hypothetical protein